MKEKRGIKTNLILEQFFSINVYVAKNIKGANKHKEKTVIELPRPTIVIAMQIANNI